MSDDLTARLNALRTRLHWPSATEEEKYAAALALIWSVREIHASGDFGKALAEPLATYDLAVAKAGQREKQ